MNTTLWAVQIALALLFFVAGAGKLLVPMDELANDSGLPGPFMRFIAVAEAAGALGLLLPGLLRIARWLTPMAAIGLALIMIGAVVTTIANGDGLRAAGPFVVGLLAAAVTWGRWQWLLPAPAALETGIAAPPVRDDLLASCRQAWEDRLDRLGSYLEEQQGNARRNGSSA